MLKGVTREVAIKLLHPGVGTENGGAQLLDEARVAARIRHPNVVPVLDAGEQDGRVFLVMEYVEGDSLLALQRFAQRTETRIPLPVVGRIVADALAGLHAAHELTGPDGRAMELVHRDFTPHNVLVGSDGITRLSDFGIAKTAENLGLTRTGLVKGKVRYMAPEQALGHALDRRCDVWAAGVVAWELLTGERLVRADNEAMALLSLIQVEPPRVTSRRRDIPAEIDQAVFEALQIDRQRRLPTALALRQRWISAFRLNGGLAEPAEVASYVQVAAGERIESLRRALTAAPASRRSLAAADRGSERRRTVLIVLASASVAAGLAWTVARATAGADSVEPEAKATAVTRAEPEPRALPIASAEPAALEPAASAKPSAAAPAPDESAPAKVGPTASPRPKAPPPRAAKPKARPTRSNPAPTGLPGLAPAPY
jgi:serine/threonine-protein kinase